MPERQTRHLMNMKSDVLVYQTPAWVDVFLHSVLSQYRAQPGGFPTAPYIFSTPFLSVRYQKMTSIEEWCCFFCKVTPHFPRKQRKIIIFYLLHNTFTAFAYNIRAPPSEV